MKNKFIWFGLLAAVVFLVIAAAPPMPPPRVQLTVTNLTGRIASPTNFLNPNVNFYSGTNVYLDKTNRGLRINFSGTTGGSALTNTGDGVGIVGATGLVTPIKSFKVRNSSGANNFLSWETNGTNITLVLGLNDGAIGLLQNIEGTMFGSGLPPDGSVIVYDDSQSGLVLSNIFHLGTNFGLAAAGGGGGSGEANTVSSVGSGVGINNPKSGVNNPLKSFTDSSPLLAITTNANEIDFAFDWVTATGSLATISWVQANSNSLRTAYLAYTDAATNALAGVVRAYADSTTNALAGVLRSYTDSATNAVAGVLRAYTDSATNALAGVLRAYTDAATNALAGVLIARMDNATNALAGVLRAYTDSATNALSAVLIARMDAATNALAGALITRMTAGTNDLNTVLRAYMDSATNTTFGYVREQASNDVRVAAGSGISVTPTASAGVVTFTVTATGSTADPQILNSNTFYTSYVVAADSQATNYVADFNVRRKTIIAAGAVHLQHSTNRVNNQGETITFKIFTGASDRGFSYNANWTCVDGSIPPTTMAANKVYFVTLDSTTNSEAGVCFWISTSGTNQLPDSAIARLDGGNTFTGGENKFKMITAEINQIGATTNLFIKNNAGGDAIASIFFQGANTSGNGAIVGLISSNFSATAYRSATVMQSYNGPFALGAHVLSGGAGVGGNPLWGHSNKVSVTGLTVGGDNSTGGNSIVWTNMLGGSATLDFAVQTLGGAEDLPITVTGAKDGDDVDVIPPQASCTGIVGSYSGFASNNTAFVRFVSTGTAQNPASGTFRVIVTAFK